MKEATSCGGVVIFRGKILVLYKNYRNKYKGWVLPKGTVEPGEAHEDTAIREVREESGANVRIRAYLADTGYTFNVSDDVVNKTVHWYLCEADAGFYKFHEAYHLLKFPNEKQILEIAYGKYIQMRKEKIW